MPAVALRDGVEEHAPALARLHRRSRAAAMPWLAEPHRQADTARWMAGTLIRHHRVHVAVVGDAPVGHVGFGQDPRHGPMIPHLYRDPAWRRQSLGTRLLAEASAAPGPRLHLHCFARIAAARRFCEARGVRPVATGDGTANEEGEPDILYRRDTPPPANEQGASA